MPQMPGIGTNQGMQQLQLQLQQLEQDKEQSRIDEEARRQATYMQLAGMVLGGMGQAGSFANGMMSNMGGMGGGGGFRSIGGGLGF